nr:hypothetical protein StreXyl84_65760 [Streptomyces sp. Xyl84]
MFVQRVHREIAVVRHRKGGALLVRCGLRRGRGAERQAQQGRERQQQASVTKSSSHRFPFKNGRSHWSGTARVTVHGRIGLPSPRPRIPSETPIVTRDVTDSA